MRIVEMSIKEIEDEKANGITEHRIWPLAELVSGSAASKMVFGCIYTKVRILFAIKLVNNIIALFIYSTMQVIDI